MSTDYRALCAELADALNGHTSLYEGHESELVARARATLSQPEPEGPTDQEIDEWQSHCAYLTRSADNGGAGTSDHYWAFDVESDHVASIVRAALARWGRPTIEPVPVSERLPGPEDCDAEERCWWFRPADFSDDVSVPSWYLDASPGPGQVRFYGYTHWLPHNALPIPTP
jgi:hypothetical protein